MSGSVLIAFAMTATWLLVFGEFGLGQALLGLTFGTVFVLVTGAGRGRIVPLAGLPRRLFYLAIYLLVLIPYAIARSNLDMAWHIARLRPAIRPAIVRVHLGAVSELMSALLAHAITMTPGEMVVDYSEDGRTIYVHLLDVAGAEAQEKSFWRFYHKILERVFA